MQESAGRLIAVLYRKSQIYWTQALKEYGITSAEYPVLIELHKQDGRTQEDVAAALDIDKSFITRTIQSLLEKEFIEKKKDENDKRCNRIYLTKKGYHTKEPIERAIVGWNKCLVGELPEDEVIGVLSQMIENIQKTKVTNRKD